MEIGGDALADLLDMFLFRAPAFVDGLDAEQKCGTENGGTRPSRSAAGERFKCVAGDRMMRLSGSFEDRQAEPCHACGHGQVRAEATAPTVGGNFHRGEMRCARTLVVFLKTING